MMKPLSSVANKREIKKLVDNEAVKKEKEDFNKGKQERKAYYSKMQGTYHRATRKLSESGHTFRKNMLEEEPTFKPKINEKIGRKVFKRSSSTGNVTADLYNEALEKKKKADFKQHESVMSLKASQYSSVLQNAGISDGMITTSDKYCASKL